MKKRYFLWNIIIACSLYMGLMLVNESRLRDLYDAEVTQIPITAQEMQAKGSSLEAATRWAVDQRNFLKEKIRNMGNPITKRNAELRNLEKYGNVLGPSYESLSKALRKEGESDDDVNKKILEGAGKANAQINAKSDTGLLHGLSLIGVAALFSSVLAFISFKKEEASGLAIAVREVLRWVGASLGGRFGVELGVFCSEWWKMDALYAEAGIILGCIGGISFSWLMLLLARKLFQ